MASKEIAAMLDTLMGRNRNSESGSIKIPNWEDDDVCGHYLAEYCPNLLFVNTKVDLGQCPNIHDDNLREAYQRAEPSVKKERRQEEFLKYAQRLLGDVDTRIKRAKERFVASQKEALMANGVNPDELEEVEMKIEILNEKINALVAQAEEAGNKGELEEAKGVLKLSDQLKDERQELQDSIKPKGSLDEGGQFGPPREMEVCDVCGAKVEIFVASNVADHNNGKMHSGFVKLKESVEALKEEVAQRREARELEREKMIAEKAVKMSEEKPDEKPDERKRSKSRERGGGRKRSRSPRKRSRSRDGERRKSGRSRSRDKRRGGGRSRSRDRKRSRSRQRGRSACNTAQCSAVQSGRVQAVSALIDYTTCVLKLIPLY
jgi:hypothetical protein